MKRLKLIAVSFISLVMVALGVSLQGCASGPTNISAERIVVQAGVMKLVEKAARPAEKAARIVAAVDLAQTLLTDTTATVDTLRSALLKRVAERELPPSEKLLAIEVINAIAAEVEQRVGTGLLSPGAIVSINTVLSWVETTAAMYVQESRAT